MAAVTLAAAWWVESTGTGRVKRYRGEVLNLADEDAARLVALGAATAVNPAPAAPATPATSSKPKANPAPAARRKPPAKKASPAPLPAKK